jgi:hypothetical protein
VAEGVRVCRTCGERENPITLAMAQALVGPLAELRDRIAALEHALVRERRPEPVGLVGVNTAAEIAGVSPCTIRRHAVRYGGVKVGPGPRAQWRFDPARLRQTAVVGNQSTRGESAAPPTSTRRVRTRADVELLPIRGGHEAR